MRGAGPGKRWAGARARLEAGAEPEAQRADLRPGKPGYRRARREPAGGRRPSGGGGGLAREARVDLVVVGPEAPLVAGVADAVPATGIAVFGPDAAAARLEGSKAFAKEVMLASGVRTAAGRAFTSVPEAEAWARARGSVVVKADGLAAGKGVVVARGADEAVEAVRALSALGEAGRTLVLEEVLDGEEVSVIALCDGERYVLLPPAQDHKRLLDGDRGPNTGGMGAYCPAPGARRRRARRGRRGGHRPGPPDHGRPRDAVPRRAVRGPDGDPRRAGGARVQRPLRRPRGAGAGAVPRRGPDPLARGLRPRCTLAPAPLALLPGASVGVVLASPGYPAAPVTGAPISGVGPHRRQLPGLPRRHGAPRRRAGDRRRPGADRLRPRAHRGRGPGQRLRRRRPHLLPRGCSTAGTSGPRGSGPRAREVARAPPARPVSAAASCWCRSCSGWCSSSCCSS